MEDIVGTLYGSLLFVVLLGVAIWLILHVETYCKTVAEQQRDYRVIHFILRLTLALGIGAVVIAVLLVVSTLGVIPSL